MPSRGKILYIFFFLKNHFPFKFQNFLSHLPLSFRMGMIPSSGCLLFWDFPILFTVILRSIMSFWLSDILGSVTRLSPQCFSVFFFDLTQLAMTVGMDLSCYEPMASLSPLHALNLMPTVSLSSPHTSQKDFQGPCIYSQLSFILSFLSLLQNLLFSHQRTWKHKTELFSVVFFIDFY